MGGPIWHRSRCADCPFAIRRAPFQAHTWVAFSSTLLRCAGSGPGTALTYSDPCSSANKTWQQVCSEIMASLIVAIAHDRNGTKRHCTGWLISCLESRELRTPIKRPWNQGASLPLTAAVIRHVHDCNATRPSAIFPTTPCPASRIERDFPK